MSELSTIDIVGIRSGKMPNGDLIATGEAVLNYEPEDGRLYAEKITVKAYVKLDGSETLADVETLIYERALSLVGTIGASDRAQLDSVLKESHATGVATVGI